MPGALHDPKDDVVQGGQHLWGLPAPHLTRILAQGHIAPMVQAIFDAPFHTHDLHHAFGYGNLRRQAGDPRAHLTRGGTLLGHPPFEPKHVVELGPVEHPAHRDRALLQAAVSFHHRRHAGEVGAGVGPPRSEGRRGKALFQIGVAQ